MRPIARGSVATLVAAVGLVVVVVCSGSDGGGNAGTSPRVRR